MVAWIRLAIMTAIAVSLLNLPARSAEVKGDLSDDGSVVMVAKVPDASQMASFENHLGIAAAGTKVRMLEQRADPGFPLKWIKVQILDGTFAGQTGWVISTTFHERRNVAEPKERVGPVKSTHRVIEDTPVFGEPNFMSPTGQRLPAGTWVESIPEATSGNRVNKSRTPPPAFASGAKRDRTTSFQFLRVHVLDGKSNGQSLWVPTHALQQRRTRCALVAQESISPAFDEANAEAVRWAWRQAKSLSAHPDVTLIASEDLEPLLKKNINLSEFDEVFVLIHVRLSTPGVLLSGDVPEVFADRLFKARLRSGTPIELFVCRAGDNLADRDKPSGSFAAQLAKHLQARKLNCPVFAYPHYNKMGLVNCSPQCERVEVSAYDYPLDSDGREDRSQGQRRLPIDRREYFPNGLSEANSGTALLIRKHNGG